MICDASKAKMYFKVENLMNYEVSSSFFSILSFSQFWIVFGRSDSQFRLRGVISCPGVASDHSGIEISLKMTILLRT